MKKVLRIGKDVKSKRARAADIMGLRMDELSVDTRVELIKELIPLGLMCVKEELEREVTRLAGGRYKRDGTPGCRASDYPVLKFFLFLTILCI